MTDKEEITQPNLRRESDRRMERLEDNMDSLGKDVAACGADMKNVKENIKNLDDKTSVRFSQVQERLNESDKTLIETRTIVGNNTELLKQIADKVGAVEKDGHAIKSVPKMLAWIGGTLAGLGGLTAYFKGWIHP